MKLDGEKLMLNMKAARIAMTQSEKDLIEEDDALSASTIRGAITILDEFITRIESGDYTIGEE